MSEGTNSNLIMDSRNATGDAVIEVRDYEQGLADMLAYVDDMLVGAMNNPDIGLLPPKMVLQVLLASLRMDAEDHLRNA